MQLDSTHTVFSLYMIDLVYLNLLTVNASLRAVLQVVLRRDISTQSTVTQTGRLSSYSA